MVHTTRVNNKAVCLLKQLRCVLWTHNENTDYLLICYMDFAIFEKLI